MDAKIARVQSAHAMKRIAAVFVSLGVAAGCQRNAGSTPPPVSEPYRLDIATLCDVVARSGADQVPPGDRTVLVATWLSSHLQTAEAHDYLVKIGPLAGNDKAAALEAEAARVGVARCALADEWRAPAPPAR
jgi:hypothetical protein